jgi:hypothetical protein
LVRKGLALKASLAQVQAVVMSDFELCDERSPKFSETSAKWPPLHRDSVQIAHHGLEAKL